MIIKAEDGMHARAAHVGVYDEDVRSGLRETEGCVDGGSRFAFRWHT